MKAMILAAGRGERMRPLTDRMPKPLLLAGGKALVEYHIEALRRAGITELVINHAHLGEQLVERLGDGHDYGVQIQYSPEPPGALETGGGIKNALPLLGGDAFWVVNGDIWTDYVYGGAALAGDSLVHLVLVSNPTHHPQGDFCLHDDRVSEQCSQRLTYSGIGIYHPDFFENTPDGAFPLAPVLRTAMASGHVQGEYYRGQWMDIGTPERLNELDRQLHKR